jgi:hypothetical protein
VISVVERAADRAGYWEFPFDREEAGVEGSSFCSGLSVPAGLWRGSAGVSTS